MVHVRVAGVALDATEQHVILLKPVGALPGVGNILPIWIGAQEASSILVAVEKAAVPRPLAHDLMISMLTELESLVERVEVTRLEGGTFFAEITLMTPAGVRIIDSRPSDAVALASRADAPIFVADDVMDDAGIADVLIEPEAEEAVEEFHRFLDDVEPDDFRE
ncbi:MAG: bifunctional nuclease family protein [Microbacterium sp.]|uniref:bifunctional nuclease family protein n=1 Tax=Microbacterium sp. TaxID=51671 RepID=UPI0026343512|nr:bifunctional nuclease family protein [Microbacterium sp.]MCX6502361.1 bifunctional nuclease family protein [Microbacterium sp.]